MVGHLLGLRFGSLPKHTTPLWYVQVAPFIWLSGLAFGRYEINSES